MAILKSKLSQTKWFWIKYILFSYASYVAVLYYLNRHKTFNYDIFWVPVIMLIIGVVFSIAAMIVCFVSSWFLDEFLLYESEIDSKKLFLNNEFFIIMSFWLPIVLVVIIQKTQ